MLGPENNLYGVRGPAVDGGFDGVAVALERKFVRHDDVLRKKARGEDVERAVDRVTMGSTGEPRRRTGIDCVVDRPDKRDFLVPDRCQIDFADTGGAE